MSALSVGVCACQPAITLLPPAATTSPLPAATVAPADRGLAVIGVDFDPPLDARQILSNGGITLVAVIENHGQRVENGVEVTAQLQDPSGRNRVADLIHETMTIPSLAPGAVEVVRFSQVSDLPVRSRYKLVVRVAPLPGETDLEDNMRSYDILVEDAAH